MVSGAGKAHAADNGKKPNIIMIISDDLGGGDMDCYGNPVMRTENLDRLAGEGMRFTNAFILRAVAARAAHRYLPAVIHMLYVPRTCMCLCL